jgi:hypothetical protein
MLCAEVGSMSPFCGTNPIHLKWSWLDPRISRAGREGARPCFLPASERGVNARSPSPALHMLCAAASPDLGWFAEKRFHCR